METYFTEAKFFSRTKEQAMHSAIVSLHSGEIKRTYRVGTEEKGEALAILWWAKHSQDKNLCLRKRKITAFGAPDERNRWL